MTCDLKNRNKIIADYLTDELTEQEMQEFEQHYFQCKVCFQQLNLCERVVDLIRDEGEAVFMYSDAQWFKGISVFFKNLRWKPTNVRFDWRFAVAFSALILILSIALPISIRHYKNSVEQKEIIIPSETFKPSGKFDNLIKQIYQSDTVLINVKPHNDANFKNEILFQWEIKKNNLPYKGVFELKIYDNKENTLHRFFVRNNQFQLKEALSPGLYYWSLMTEDEMVHLGRFYVRKP